ncbi:MAG: lipid-A-disaccharide synthase [Bacteroidales bacterium]|nr:lipid-A-disaccharide synthase [Bacteroidales bacterium]
MKYFIIAGEASGDLHGSNLVKEIKKIDPDADILCWGGNKMQEAGARLLVHYRELAIMGFWEVLMKLGKIFRNLKKCRQQILEYKPDLVILIDYPGFNLRIAEKLKIYNINIYYYISPKVWAWKKSRIKKIKRYIDRMYVIFPFEKAFYEENDYRVHYFGNPLVETVKEGMAAAGGREALINEHKLEAGPVITLLAGSRIQEVKRILPVMAGVEKYYPAYQFVVAGISTIDESLYSDILKNSNIRLIYDSTYRLLSVSDAALVTSGTATLETAIADIPQVVCYRAGRLSYLIARILVKIRFISLVNLIMDREIVRELIQADLNERNIISELNAILPGGPKREIMLKNYSALRKMLAGEDASSRIAKDMYHSVKLADNVK